MSGKFVNVGDKLYFVFFYSRAAHAAPYRYFDARGLALKGVEHEPPVLHKVKSRPVDLFKRRI